MTAKAKHCGKCKHFDATWAAQAAKVVCTLKHYPRFYYAQLNKAGQIPGWKRRCEDFKESKQ